MINEEIIMECGLADGVTAVVRDASRHYFGGYYHVRLLVTADVALSAAWFGGAAEYEDAVGRLGSSVRFSRTLEKMAVPRAEVDAVRSTLLDSFETNLRTYLFRPDFPRRFALSEYGKARKPVVQRGYAGA
ncbi:MAG: hypothetical protein HYV06_02545 [Deltaproteobacteria bacterium]|nr:hypothetical protein [Deltaproteobacteria bacterium]